MGLEGRGGGHWGWRRWRAVVWWRSVKCFERLSDKGNKDKRNKRSAGDVLVLFHG